MSENYHEVSVRSETTMTDDLKARLDALHVWPQAVADAYAAELTPRQIDKLYAVGKVATEAADRIATLEAALADMMQQRDRQYDENVSLIAKQAATETERDAAMAGAVKSVCDNGHQCPNGPHGSCCGEFALTPDPDRMLALTAAAYGDAAQTAADRCAACGCREIASLVKEHVIRRTPANALAALSRIEAQAEARGMRKAARLADEGYAAGSMGNPGHHILALAAATEAEASEKEPTHD